MMEFGVPQFQTNPFRILLSIFFQCHVGRRLAAPPELKTAD